MAHDVRRMIMPNDPIVVEAVEAMKRYHEALEADEPPAEIARLRLLAASSGAAVSVYQRLPARCSWPPSA